MNVKEFEKLPVCLGVSAEQVKLFIHISEPRAAVLISFHSAKYISLYKAGIIFFLCLLFSEHLCVNFILVSKHLSYMFLLCSILLCS